MSILNMFSNYQRSKKNLSERYYDEVDIVIQKQKLEKIKNRYESYDNKLKEIADRHIQLCTKNIEFICRQINQQNLERAIIYYK